MNLKATVLAVQKQTLGKKTEDYLEYHLKDAVVAITTEAIKITEDFLQKTLNKVLEENSAIAEGDSSAIAGITNMAVEAMYVLAETHPDLLEKCTRGSDISGVKLQSSTKAEILLKDTDATITMNHIPTSKSTVEIRLDVDGVTEATVLCSSDGVADIENHLVDIPHEGEPSTLRISAKQFSEHLKRLVVVND